MGKDMDPRIKAHLTPILFTMGPPKKQTERCLCVSALELSWKSRVSHTDSKQGISDRCGNIGHLRGCETTTTKA